MDHDEVKTTKIHHSLHFHMLLRRAVLNLLPPVVMGIANLTLPGAIWCIHNIENPAENDISPQVRKTAVSLETI